MITAADIDIMKNIFVTKEDLRSELAKFATKQDLEQIEQRIDAKMSELSHTLDKRNDDNRRALSQELRKQNEDTRNILSQELRKQNEDTRNILSQELRKQNDDNHNKLMKSVYKIFEMVGDIQTVAEDNQTEIRGHRVAIGDLEQRMQAVQT